MPWGTPTERFWDNVDKDGPIPEKNPELGPCWIWLGGKKKAGYGQFEVNDRKVIAHRWAYKEFVGKLLVGYEIDHKCNNPSCVNYETHLEQVTLAENRRRRKENKTHCINNHEYTGANTGYLIDRSGYENRYCKTCNRIKHQKRRAAAAANQ